MKLPFSSSSVLSKRRGKAKFPLPNADREKRGAMDIRIDENGHAGDWGNWEAQPSNTVGHIPPLFNHLKPASSNSSSCAWGSGRLGRTWTLHAGPHHAPSTAPERVLPWALAHPTFPALATQTFLDKVFIELLEKLFWPLEITMYTYTYIYMHKSKYIHVVCILFIYHICSHICL